MSMQEGLVVEWRVRPPARVEKGQVLLVIESEKTEAEVEASASGVLRHIYVEPGETVLCQTLLAVITDTADEPFEPEAYGRRTLQPERARPAAVPRAASSTGPAAAAPAARPVTPAARKRAREIGLDPTQIPGSGPGGRVTREDVDSYARGLESRVTVADGVALEVLDQGAGTTVVLLPGFGTDVSAFARQVPALAEHYRVLALNPRGVGLSDAPEADAYAVTTMAEDTAHMLGAQGHVIGASLGAAAALELALACPDRVRSLSLITPFVRASARLLAVIEAWQEVAALALPQVLARSVTPWLFSEEFLSDEVRRARALGGFAQAAEKIPVSVLGRYAQGLRAWDGVRVDALSGLAVPTLVVAAGADLLTPGAAEIASAIPNAKLAVLQGAGHAVTLEAPGEVNAVLLEHLQSIDGGH
jgi:pimeloyl-ACP methyl ester carboxylesterase